MSQDKKLDAMAIALIIFNFIGIVLLLATPFAGLYWTGFSPGNRYSCIIDCGYTTGGDLAAQIIVLLLLIIQIVLAINELVPKRFINFGKLDIIGLILGGSIILFSLIGLGAFGIFYAAFDWWPEAGWYGGFVCGIINTILYALKFKEII
ncbi:MAG: hypothetical protein ACXAEX_11895 [Promethearchaeota archaeon]|jgi:hypothetical protein